MNKMIRNAAGRITAILLSAAAAAAPAQTVWAGVVGGSRGAAQESAAASSEGNTTLQTVYSQTAADSSAATLSGAPGQTTAVSASTQTFSITPNTNAGGASAPDAGGAESADPSSAASDANGEFAEAIAPASATVQSASWNSAEPRVVTSTLFNGGELLMMAPDGASQMMAFVITTKNGSVIVIDGGTENETEHLKSILLKKGGRVAAWLVTHPHSDHVGAMTKILNDANSGITVDNVYYNYAPIEWYYANEEYRADMVKENLAALSKLSPSVNHPNIQKGEVINVDDVKITVMNQPYLFQTNSINNSSVAFRVEMNGKRILFLGDMGVPAGNSFLNEYRNNIGELKADIVEMAHHGEEGVDRNVYEAIKPTICLWCCPAWLWDNDSGSGTNSGKWKTLEVRNWMRQLGAKTHVVEKDGDQVLR